MSAASVGRSRNGQDRADGLGPKDEHAVAAISGETPTPSPIETNNVVERLRELDERGLPHDVRKLGPEAADLIQSLSDRIDVLTRLVVAMDDHVSDCCGCFGTAEEEMLAAMNECRASLTQGGKTNG